MQKQKTKPDKRPRASAAQVAGPPTVLKPWHYALALAAAFVAVLLAYEPALGGPFVLDDLYLPFTYQEFADASLRRWISGVRPLLMFSFWVNHTLSGMSPSSYHFTNVLLHLGTSVAVFLIVRKLLERAGETGLKRDGLASFAAGVFLLHPLQTESVAYVASRSEVLSVLLFYAAFTLFLYRRHEAISWLESIGVLALFGAAVTTKEHAAVLPAMLLLTDYWWNPGFSFRGIRRNWKLYALTAAGAALAARTIWRVLRTAESAGFGVRDFTWYQYFYTQCRGIWMYVRMFVLPYGQNIDHDFRPSYTVFDHGAVVGLVALLAAATAALWFRKRFPLACYGMLTFLLLLAPTSSFVPIQDVVAERRMYLPMLGLLLVVVEFARRWKTTAGTATAALAGILAVMGYLTYARSAVWTSSIALWEDSVAKAPDKQRPRSQLAFAYFEAGRCDVALNHYAAAARNGKVDFRLLMQWSSAYECAGNNSAALEKLRQAEKLTRNAPLYTQFALVYINQSRWNDALQALATAEQLEPGFETTYVYRAAVFGAQGNWNGAVQEYQRALSVNPASDRARQGLAIAQQRMAAGR